MDPNTAPVIPPATEPLLVDGPLLVHEVPKVVTSNKPAVIKRDLEYFILG